MTEMERLAEQAKALSVQEYKNKLAMKSNMMRAQAAQIIGGYTSPCYTGAEYWSAT